MSKSQVSLWSGGGEEGSHKRCERERLSQMCIMDMGQEKGRMAPRFFTWVVDQVSMPSTKTKNLRRASWQRNIVVEKVEKLIIYL